MLVNFYTTSSKEVMRISSTGGLGIGTSQPSEVIDTFNIWNEIQMNAEKNPAMKIALQNLINLHNLTKDHGNSEA